MEASFSLDNSTPLRQSGLSNNGLDTSSSDVGSVDAPLFTSGIADSLVGGVGLLVVIPVVAGAAAVLMALMMFRSGRFDGESFAPFIVIVIVTGVVAVVAVALIYMISNVFVV